MSVKAMTWAFAQRTEDPGLKVLLLALADYAGDDGVTWPRRSTLSEIVEVSERTITRYTKQLIDMGLVTVEQRKLDNGANSSNCFRLRLDRQIPLLPPGQFVPAPETHGVQAPGTACVHTPETHGVSTIEPLREPSREPKKQGALVAERPDWLPPEWDDFIADRRERKKPMTARSQKLAMATLDQLRREGHDPAAVIRQSIERGWSALFPLKADRKVVVGRDSSQVVAEAVRLIQGAGE